MKSNQILKLCLLSTPIILTSFLFNFWQPQKVQASEVKPIDITIVSPNGDITEYSGLEKNEDGYYMLNFTDEESDAAIKLYGCDCPSSINKLKKLRGMQIGVYGEALTDDVYLATCPHQQFLAS
ncbi:hypothetical protein ACN4EE_04585 [Geminocystis sp. CENA526]|uniref:hypothetical protein n=1 Tax=Geminocystis sp. CENA526 TaxID=1355871 RepID=UPI003D6F7B7D